MAAAWFSGLALTVLVAANSAVAAQTLATPPQSRDSLFMGCERADEIVNTGPSAARKKIEAAADRTDPISQRVFKSFSISEARSANAGGESSGDCWARLDGIWQEDQAITLDDSYQPEGWGALKPELLELAHGTYTVPLLIVVEASEDEQSLSIRSALGPGKPVRFIALKDSDIFAVLTSPGDRKAYQSQSVRGEQETLTVDTTRSGYVRLRLGDREFLRPKPNVSAAARANQANANDLFAVSYNPKNLRASRQSYDIAEQNPDRFLDNDGRGDVFAPAKLQDYYIAEQLTIPLGLKLVPEGAQGSIYFNSLMASEAELQQGSSSSFGANAGVSGGGEQGDKYGASFGQQHAQSQFSAMKQRESVSRAAGYQRMKRYAMVRDLPFSRLSDRFIDAVDDARRSGDYLRLIKRFGTHYAYAMTYGAAGVMTSEQTAKTFSDMFGDTSSSGTDIGVKLGPVKAGAMMRRAENLRQTNLVTNEYGTTTFDAVGGNGSWNESGFMAGDTPYPILADLHPLHELLNPILFPGEAEVFERVRRELGAAISTYLSERADLISQDSLLTGVRADMARQKQLAAAAAAKANEPAALPQTVLVDGNQIRVSHKRVGRSSTVTVCLHNTAGWNKGIGLAGNWKQAKSGQSVCLSNVAAKPVRLEFYKAKFMGVMTKMATKRFDLSGHQGRRVNFSWAGD